jgi:hypothetical protein
VKTVPSLTQNPTNSLIKNQPINTGHVLIPKLSPTTKRPIKKPIKPSHSKPWPKFIQKNITYYKYDQKGNTSRFCRVNTKHHKL